MRALLIVVVVTSGSPALADYAQPGTLAVTKSAGSVTVAGANFALDAYLPNTGGPWPVIALGHGFSNSKDNMQALAQLLATRGNVVVVPQFPVGSSDHARNGQALLAAIDWAIGNAAFAGKVDASRQGVAGHSAGGLASFLAAASRPSLRAVVLLDAVDSNNLGQPQVGNVKMPVLLTFAEPATCNANTNTTAWWAGLTGTRGQLKVVGAGHCDAQDPPNSVFCTLPCGAVNAARQTLFKRYAVAWLQYFVSCELAARDAVDGAQTMADTTAGGLSGVQHVGVPPAPCAVPDGGVVDAGLPDAGAVDAGAVTDAGVTDAGAIDSGVADAGTIDGGSGGGSGDGGPVDGGATDAGAADGGTGGELNPPRGCGCSSGGFAPAMLLGVLTILARRRRGR
ncbi:MAG: chlorophyllase family protein [Myxococcaceae bacterium]|nr:chlorophyllase family protein [Myxococcaceae bacterium]